MAIARELSIFGAINTLLSQIELPPPVECDTLGVNDIVFEEISTSSTQKAFELTPLVDAACTFPLGGIPIPFDTLIGVTLNLEFGSIDFETDVPNSLQVGAFSCEDGFSVINKDTGEPLSFGSDICELFGIEEEIKGVLENLPLDDLLAQLKELAGEPFSPTALADILLSDEAAFDDNGLSLVNQDDMLQVVASFVGQIIEIPFVVELLGEDVAEQLKTFIDSGFDPSTFIPEGYYYYNNRALQYGEYGEETSTLATILGFLFVINPELAANIQEIPINELLTATIPEAFDLIGFENDELEQVLVTLYGDEATVAQLISSEESIEILLNTPVAAFFPVFIDDPELVATLNQIFGNTTFNDILQIPNLTIDEFLAFFGADAALIDQVSTFVNTTVTVAKFVAAIESGDVLDLIIVDLTQLLPPEVLPVLDLIFSGDIPSDPVAIIEGVIEFVLVRLEEFTLDFSQPFPQPQVELLQLIAAFDPLVAENIAAVSTGTITVGEFAALAGLSEIAFPISEGLFLSITPVVASVSSNADIVPNQVEGSASIVLPAIQFGEGSTVNFAVEVQLVDSFGTPIGDAAQVALQLEFAFSLEAAVGIVADVEGLLDIGLFNIDDVNDVAQVGGEVAACAASNVGFGVVSVAPNLDLDISFAFSDAEDAALEAILNAVIGDLYANFLPNLVNGFAKGFQGSSVNLLEAEEECASNSIAANAEGDDNDALPFEYIIPAAIVGMLLLLVIAVVVTKSASNKKSKTQAEKDILEAKTVDEVKTPAAIGVI